MVTPTMTSIEPQKSFTTLVSSYGITRVKLFVRFVRVKASTVADDVLLTIFVQLHLTTICSDGMNGPFNCVDVQSGKRRQMKGECKTNIFFNRFQTKPYFLLTRECKG